MFEPQRELLEILDAVPETPDTFSEYDIQAKIQALIRAASDSGKPPDPALLAESAAFAFVEDYRTDHWGTYYGPMFVLPNDQGQMVEFPGIGKLSAEDIEYWGRRAMEARNPCLRVRYADLVWDLSEKVSGTKPDYRIALLAIDATVEVASRRLHKHHVSTIKKLRRALHLALSLNDGERTAAVRDATIAFEDAVAQDHLPGLWGFSFDILLAGRNVPLDPEQTAHIVQALEDRLERIGKAESPGTSEIAASQAAATRLDRYYQSQSRPMDSRRVLQAHAQLVTRVTPTLEPLVAHHWLQELFHQLSSRGFQDDANALTELIRHAGKDTVENLTEISHEISIPTEEIDAYFNSFCTGTADEALYRLAGHFVPNHEHIERQIRDLAEKAPLQSLIAHTILDASGRPVAKIGPLDTDIEGRIVNQTSQNLQIEAPFLRGAIERITGVYSLQPEDLLRFLRRSPVFTQEAEPFLRAGLEAYAREGYVSAICTLIPQVEAAVRALAALIRAPIYKLARHGGLALRSLDELLHDEAIVAVLGQRTASYLSIVFTDQRGWNLRNDVCHGFVPGAHLGPVQADRLIHALLLLSMLEEKERPKQ
jgi:hypothetical protein